MSKLTANINAGITTVAAAGCITFLFGLIGHGVRPAAHDSNSRDEVLSVLPTGEQQNPVARAFDQVTGVWEAVNGLEHDYRAEFVPRECLESPRCSLHSFMRPTTRLVVAPGTSKGTDLLVPPGTAGLPVRVLLTSVTGDATVNRLAALDADVTAPANSTMAQPLAAAIAEKTRHQCLGVHVHADKGDPAYSVSLKTKLEEELAKVCKTNAPPDTLHVLIGNEPWWNSGERPDLTQARLVVLSDGLSSTRVLRGVERAAPRFAKVLAVRVNLRTDPKSACYDKEHRALEHRQQIPYGWHIVAREATCLTLRRLLGRANAELPVAVVELQPLSAEDNGVVGQ